MCLEHLSKKNNEWQRLALYFCRDKDIASEIVQKMYLRLYDYDLTNEKLTKEYVSRVIFNIFKDYVKKESSTISLDSVLHLSENENGFSFSDKELDLINRIDDNDKNLLIENYDKSANKMSNEKNISRKHMCHKLNTIRKKVLKDDYHLYKNSRVKYSNKKK